MEAVEHTYLVTGQRAPDNTRVNVGYFNGTSPETAIASAQEHLKKFSGYTYSAMTAIVVSGKRNEH